MQPQLSLVKAQLTVTQPLVQGGPVDFIQEVVGSSNSWGVWL